MRPVRRVRSVEYGLRLFQPLKRHQFSALSQAVRIRALEATAILKAVCPQPVLRFYRSDSHGCLFWTFRDPVLPEFGSKSQPGPD